MSVFVATYDIRRNSSRQKVAGILVRYGRRLQNSVFELDLEPEDLPDLKREIGPWLDVEDLFDIFPVDTRRLQSRIRWQKTPYGESVQLF
jgi:CRISPR-associated endonuclease Cas2